MTTVWYQKKEATFSDCLALARKHIWDSGFHAKSAFQADFVSLSKQALSLIGIVITLAMIWNWSRAASARAMASGEQELREYACP